MGLANDDSVLDSLDERRWLPYEPAADRENRVMVNPQRMGR